METDVGQTRLWIWGVVLGARRRQWHPTPVLLPGKSYGRRSLEGCSPWGLLRVEHNWVTSLLLFTFMHWRRKWQPTPVFLPGESQGWGEPGGLLSMGSHRVGHDWSNLAAACALGKVSPGATTTERKWCNSWSPHAPEPVFCIKEKPLKWDAHTPQLRQARTAAETQCSPNK